MQCSRLFVWLSLLTPFSSRYPIGFCAKITKYMDMKCSKARLSASMISRNVQSNRSKILFLHFLSSVGFSLSPLFSARYNCWGYVSGLRYDPHFSWDFLVRETKKYCFSVVFYWFWIIFVEEDSQVQVTFVNQVQEKRI